MENLLALKSCCCSGSISVNSPKYWLRMRIGELLSAVLKGVEIIEEGGPFKTEITSFQFLGSFSKAFYIFLEKRVVVLWSTILKLCTQLDNPKLY